MTLETRLTLCLSAIALFSAACGDGKTTCFDDRTCGLGMRCAQARSGEQGTCEACDATETPYDGVDNDCSARTKDVDLDGDNDNWRDSPIRPGTDCDDNDPDTNPEANELCGDAKDNDCDGTIDEIDCGDMAAPTVMILDPRDNGPPISGNLNVRVLMNDDIGVVKLVLTTNGVEQHSAMLPQVRQNTAEIQLSTPGRIADGITTLVATVTDVKGNTASDMVQIEIDNGTGPAITPERPQEGRAYGGTMLISADVVDVSRVAFAQIELDDVVVMTSSSGASPVQYMLDTTTLTESAHTVRFTARDGGSGAVSTRTIGFIVDNTAPVVSFLLPHENDTLTGTIDLNVTATDANSTPVIDVAAVNLAGASPLSGQFNSALLSNGAHTLTAVATDAAEVSGAGGNASSVDLHVTVSNMGTGPAVEILQPTANARVFGRTRVIVDTGMSTPQLDYRIDGDHVATVPLRSSVTLDLAAYAGRTVTLSVTATDISNNATATDSVILDVVAGPGFVTDNMVSVEEILYSDFDVKDVTGDGIKDIVSAGARLRVIEGAIDNQIWHPALVHSLTVSDAQSARVVDIPSVNGPNTLMLLSGGAITLTYLLPTGDFATPVLYPHDVGGILVFGEGDVDGDGDIDVVVINNTGASQVMLWDGAAFVKGGPLANLSNCIDFDLADVDNDDDLDLVVGGVTPSTIFTLYLNDGTGVFGAPRQVDTNFSPDHVRVGDVSGDGYPDVVARTAGTWRVMVGQPGNPGSYTPGPIMSGIPPNAIFIRIIDIDGDGRNDILFNGPDSGGIEVWRNPLGGPLTLSGYAIAKGVHRFALADMNNDSRLDILGSSPIESEIDIARGEAGGTFYAPILNLIPVMQVTAIGVAQLGAGANPQLVVGTNVPPSVSVYSLAAGVLTNPTVVPVGLGPSGFAFADVDNSGTTDVVVAADTEGYLLSNQGGFVFTNTPVTGFDLARAVAVGDLDGDNTPEVIFTDSPAAVGPDSAIVYNAPALTQRIRLTGGENPIQVMVANVDSDPANTPDIAMLNLTSANLVLHRQTSGSWSSDLFSMPMRPTRMILTQIDGDARSDLVVSTETGISVYLGDPNLVFAAPQFTPVGDITDILALDLDADAQNDLVALSRDGTLVMILRGPGGALLPPVAFPIPPGPTALRAADFDGDGRVDIAVAHTSFIPLVTMIQNRPFQ